MRLLGEKQNGITSYYIYDNGYNPLARIEGTPGEEKISYFHNNLAGLPEQLTDSQGNSIWQAEYKIWGNAEKEWKESRSNFDQNLRYQGQYLDRETGLHYNTFRYFDPDIGRFTQPDPIGLLGGNNLYQYAPNPVSWIDPWGWACNRLRDDKGRFRKALNASEEVSSLPDFTGKKTGQIRQILKNRGYTSTPANSGGEVWTKSLPDGNTVSVRMDPAKVRNPALGYADEVPHTHIETVPTSSVSGGNYPPSTVSGRHTASGGTSTKASNPNHNQDVHIPMGKGRSPYN
ncbi:RHS repeat-associated core domain-containing protein [Gilliamella sp. wkB112]|uniref:RHS repeat-associated core domain-containing protein n=1 Tax=Gilliamella sp. wkB112 TaxID=3120257 RepID=UPI00080E1D90|nr:RHS repeat-associated core domain-containing protein [Gilliamella apicola]OCG00765.1 hypothetical protein A9G12_03100 [Gilliamella apicola]